MQVTAPDMDDTLLLWGVAPECLLSLVLLGFNHPVEL